MTGHILASMWGIRAPNLDHSDSCKVMFYSFNLYLQVAYVAYMSLLIAYLQPSSHLPPSCTPAASAAIVLGAVTVAPGRSESGSKNPASLE